MARRPGVSFDEKALTRTQRRKLKDLRKSLGQKEGLRTFKAWLADARAELLAARDQDAEIVAEALGALAEKGALRIPRGGYLVTRGRHRVIVTRPGETES